MVKKHISVSVDHSLIWDGPIPYSKYSKIVAHVMISHERRCLNVMNLQLQKLPMNPSSTKVQQYLGDL